MNFDVPRRTVISGGLVTAVVGELASTTGALAADLPNATATALMRTVSDRLVLSRLTAAPGEVVYLVEAGRAGIFRYGPILAEERASDPLQGLFISASAVGAGWSRLWDGTHGRPEWFGAKINDPTADCAEALEACHAACPVTLLSHCDYFVRRTVHLTHDWRTMRGSGRYATNEGQGTRIILQASAPALQTADIILLGSKSRPANLTIENHLVDFTIMRDGQCASHPSGDPARYPTGLRLAYLARCTVSGIASLESSIGFNISGVVYGKIEDCFAQRLRAGSAGLDLAIGFFLDGRIQFGYPGGNASLYMDRCLAAEQHAHHVDPAGLVALGAFVDTFIDRFESARIGTGMAFRVDGARSPGATIDLHIRNAVLDGCGRVGLDLNLDSTASAAVEIIDPYVTPAGSGGEHGIAVRDGAGLITITGGQIIGDFAGGSLFVSRTRGVHVQGLKIQQSVRPVVVAAASGLNLAPQISNVAKTSVNFAVECRGVSRARIAPIIIGFTQPAFAGGVSLDDESHHVAIDGSAIDPDCFAATGGASMKVTFGGVDVRSNSAFRLAGNVLTGVVN